MIVCPNHVNNHEFKEEDHYPPIHLLSLVSLLPLFVISPPTVSAIAFKHININNINMTLRP